MDFGFNDEYKMIQKMYREFAEKVFPVGKNASRRPHCGEGGDVISDAEKKGWAIWISR